MCPDCGNPLRPGANSCACGWGQKRGGSPYRHGIKIGDEWIDKQCAWNDHGRRCEAQGWLSMATNGHGPWYCATDFEKLRRGNPGAFGEVSAEQHAEWVEDIKNLIKAKRAA